MLIEIKCSKSTPDLLRLASSSSLLGWSGPALNTGVEMFHPSSDSYLLSAYSVPDARLRSSHSGMPQRVRLAWMSSKTLPLWCCGVAKGKKGTQRCLEKHVGYEMARATEVSPPRFCDRGDVRAEHVPHLGFLRGAGGNGASSTIGPGSTDFVISISWWEPFRGRVGPKLPNEIL